MNARKRTKGAPEVAPNTTLPLSIVICTYNRYDVLLEAITSIETQTLDPDAFELIVVDNSSDIAAQEDFTRGLNIECNATYITEEISGLSRARNIGAHKAIGEIIAFIDDDAIAKPEWAESILESFGRFPNAGIAGGPVLPIWPNARPPWLHPWLDGFLTIVERGPEMRELRKDEWVAGTNIAFRRDPLLAVGGFNESVGRIGKLLLSNEELMLTERLKSDGYIPVYNPRQIVQHRVHADRVSQSWLRQRVAWQAISDIFVNPHGGTSNFEKDVKLIQSFLQKLPGRHRSIHGLFVDLQDPAIFQAQTEAVAALVRLTTQNATDWQTLLHSDV